MQVLQQLKWLKEVTGKQDVIFSHHWGTIKDNWPSDASC
jgi:hypothetical protein